MLKVVPSGKTFPCSPFPPPCCGGPLSCLPLLHWWHRGRQGCEHSLHARAVFHHAGAVCVLVDLHGNEVGCDGDHQSIPNDS